MDFIQSFSPVVYSWKSVTRFWYEHFKTSVNVHMYCVGSVNKKIIKLEILCSFTAPRREIKMFKKACGHRQSFIPSCSMRFGCSLWQIELLIYLSHYNIIQEFPVDFTKSFSEAVYLFMWDYSTQNVAAYVVSFVCSNTSLYQLTAEDGWKSFTGPLVYLSL